MSNPYILVGFIFVLIIAIIIMAWGLYDKWNCPDCAACDSCCDDNCPVCPVCGDKDCPKCDVNKKFEYQKNENKDHRLDDILQLKDRNVDTMKKICDSLPECKAFNSSGWLKTVGAPIADSQGISLWVKGDELTEPPKTPV